MKLPVPHPAAVEQFCYGPSARDGSVPVYWLDRASGKRSDTVITVDSEPRARAVAHMLQTLVNFNRGCDDMRPILATLTDLFGRFEA